MDRSTDAQIVERVLRGDAELYAELVERYRDRYARYALHMLGNREDAEEALQDAFTRADRSRARPIASGTAGSVPAQVRGGARIRRDVAIDGRRCVGAEDARHARLRPIARAPK